MPETAPKFQLKIASSEADVRAAQRLRYSVFVDEMGASGAGIDHGTGLETDRHDLLADHLLLIDPAFEENRGVVGTYRLTRRDMLADGGKFYSQQEFDLSPLLSKEHRLLELGRSCVHPTYRRGTAMYELWSGLGAYIALHEIDMLFGVASFPGTEVARMALPLSYLHHNYLAPEALRVRARGAAARDMDLVADADLDRRAAILQIPPLIKGYLRLGGFVGQGAWVDHAFNTTDVCMILDMARIDPRQRELYTKERVLL